MEEIDELRKEVRELKAEFELYWNSTKAARELWHEAHPNQKDIWPDTGKMVSWIVREVVQLRENEKALIRILESAVESDYVRIRGSIDRLRETINEREKPND